MFLAELRVPPEDISGSSSSSTPFEETTAGGVTIALVLILLLGIVYYIYKRSRSDQDEWPSKSASGRDTELSQSGTVNPMGNAYTPPKIASDAV